MAYAWAGHAKRKGNEMENSELCKMVRDLSLELMNTGKGDGTIYMCYSDQEIIEDFEGMTEEQVVRQVKRDEGLRAELFNEILLASGEYDFPENEQPRLKPFWSSVRTERTSVERSGFFRAQKMANVRNL